MDRFTQRLEKDKNLYNKIKTKDIERGDVIYYAVRQENDRMHPYKFRPALVVDVWPRADMIDTIPITHTGPQKSHGQDPLARYNTELPEAIEKVLQTKSKDKRPSYLNPTQECNFNLSDFNDECYLQRICTKEDYGGIDPLREAERKADKQTTQLENDYTDRVRNKYGILLVSKNTLSHMHYSNYLDPNLVEEYPKDFTPVDQDYIKHNPIRTRQNDLDFE